MKPLRTLLLYAASPESETLSYQTGWPAHFARHGRFDCVAVNVLDRRAALSTGIGLALRRLRVDVVVILHSVLSNALYLRPGLERLIGRLPQLTACFVGNEHKMMPLKIAFLERIGVGLLVSQSTDTRVHDVYRRRLGCHVVGIPSAALDDELFRPRKPRSERPIDLGYRAYDTPLYLGHDERRRVAQAVVEHPLARGLRFDVSLDPADRLSPEGWAGFLNECKGQLGTEAGADYFELTDETRFAVNAYVAERPDATLAEVRRRFFDGRPPAPPMRALSGRVVEAAATKTVQILVEGEYGGFFLPDVHYIPLRNDFSNVGDALAKFGDEDLCGRLVEESYSVAREQLTYSKLIDRFHDALRPLL